MSGSDTQGSTASMEEEQLEEEFPPERIEPFAKMSQVATTPLEKEATIPVKFRRNLFEDGPPLPDADEESAMNMEKQQMFYKPAHHMRAQPRAAYSAMDPQQRRQAELLDTALARQQLLLRQQQEAVTVAHRQQVDQQAQQLVNRSLAVGTTSTTPTNQQLQPQADHQTLTTLLNEACVLTPQRAPLAMQPQPLSGNFQPGGMVWAPSPPMVSAQGYFNNPMTVLGNPAVGAAPPGAPGGFMAMNQEELMQAVRKELKRMQQE